MIKTTWILSRVSNLGAANVCMGLWAFFNAHFNFVWVMPFYVVLLIRLREEGERK
jgi:hypothetical protein